MKTIEIKNKKARYAFHLIERFEAGLQLSGSEVKSLRLGNANFRDAYCLIVDGELFIKKMYIAEYEPANIFNHQPDRDRKLLLKKRELRKIEKKVQAKGFTVIPVRLYFNERGLAKLEIALAQGKKAYDKRQSIKERDQKRELSRLDKM